MGGSAIVGAGTQELSMLKLNEGIYFIGIEAATGNGSFLMYTYAGVFDQLSAEQYTVKKLTMCGSRRRMNR